MKTFRDPHDLFIVVIIGLEDRQDDARHGKRCAIDSVC